MSLEQIAAIEVAQVANDDTNHPEEQTTTAGISEQGDHTRVEENAKGANDVPVDNGQSSTVTLDNDQDTNDDMLTAITSALARLELSCPDISMPDMIEEEEPAIDSTARGIKRDKNKSRNHYGTRVNGASLMKRNRPNSRIPVLWKNDTPGYTDRALIPDTADSRARFNFDRMNVKGWDGLSHAWEKDFTMVDAPPIIYMDPDTPMKTLLGAGAGQKRSAETAKLDDDSENRAKRQKIGLQPNPDAVHGKREFDDNVTAEVGLEQNVTDAATYAPGRTIKRYKDWRMEGQAVQWDCDACLYK
ncbi:hypothetical protein FB567DRAFT_247541 [Paraphoma chrysanthemicola]|uniref:Uncharacterized protein n=1 Tax=Paraphoma chrysanthemicola TaxID=798071 RepID=A0A8K0VRF5_9PLEO|nr:hypothetical protein FB567DRAFT_247541 [Paraphoma chrysanthemicola]